MGTTFERAITQVPLCNPSRTSVLTGQQPSQTGVLDNDMPWYERVDPADTLPAVLKAAGRLRRDVRQELPHRPDRRRAPAVMFDEFVVRRLSTATRPRVDPGRRLHDDPVQVRPLRRAGERPARRADGRRRARLPADRAGDLDQPFFLGVGITKPHRTGGCRRSTSTSTTTAEIRAALERASRTARSSRATASTSTCRR